MGYTKSHWTYSYVTQGFQKSLIIFYEKLEAKLANTNAKTAPCKLLQYVNHLLIINLGPLACLTGTYIVLNDLGKACFKVNEINSQICDTTVIYPHPRIEKHHHRRSCGGLRPPMTYHNQHASHDFWDILSKISVRWQPECKEQASLPGQQPIPWTPKANKCLLFFSVYVCYDLTFPAIGVAHVVGCTIWVNMGVGGCTINGNELAPVHLGIIVEIP